MSFRTGYRAEYLRTPWLYRNNGKVFVQAGKTLD